METAGAALPMGGHIVGMARMGSSQLQGQHKGTIQGPLDQSVAVRVNPLPPTLSSPKSTSAALSYMPVPGRQVRRPLPDLVLSVNVFALLDQPFQASHVAVHGVGPDVR